MPQQQQDVVAAFKSLPPDRQRGLLLKMNPEQRQKLANAITAKQFPIKPKDGESFTDTMKRAAAAGKNVSPELIQSQTMKGLKEAPGVLAAAPVMGAAGAAALAAPGAIAAVGPKAISALQAAAKSHPFVAEVVKTGLKYGVGGLAGAEGIKIAKSLGLF